MTLTERQRQQLSVYAEWRDLQIALYRVTTDLANTRLEDVQMQQVMDALNSISMRRAAFLEQFLRNNLSQGGL